MYIAQASSEHSICFATKEMYCEGIAILFQQHTEHISLPAKAFDFICCNLAAKKAVEEAFFYELRQSLISAVKVITDCSIIAAVGESMSNCPGVSGLFFGALGKAGINILSISQVAYFV
jgi:aspartokinase/homoserine dehydrogenase 1